MAEEVGAAQAMETLIAPCGTKPELTGGVAEWAAPPVQGREVIRLSLVLAIVVFTLFSGTGEAFAQRRGWGWYEGMPYGQFCPHRQWGGPYGVRRPVRTVDEARQVIESYFAARQKAVTVGRIVERKWFFLAEILDGDGTIVDETIVDRRTGRIRSIY